MGDSPTIFVGAVLAVAVVPVIYGHAMGWVGYQGGVLTLLGSIAISVAYIAGEVHDAD